MPTAAIHGMRPVTFVGRGFVSVAIVPRSEYGSDTPARMATVSVDHSTEALPAKRVSGTSCCSVRSRSGAMKSTTDTPTAGTNGPAKYPAYA